MARLQALEADGWKTYTSRSTGRKYYYNERTDESTYTLPEPSVPATPPRARAPEEAAPPEEEPEQLRRIIAEIETMLEAHPDNEELVTMLADTTAALANSHPRPQPEPEPEPEPQPEPEPELELPAEVSDPEPETETDDEPVTAEADAPSPSAHTHALQRLLEEKQEALSAMVRKVEGLATVEPAQQAELESLLTEVEALDQALDALPT